MSERIKVGQIREIDKANDKLKKVEFEGLEIEVKQYIPLSEKRLIAETITHSSFVIDKETNLNRFDRGLADATWGVLLIRYYTNINGIKDPFQMYDIIKGNGILDTVEETIPVDEINTLTTMVRTRIDEVFRLEESSLQIGYKMEGLVDVFTEKVDKSLDVLKNFDTEDLGTISNLIKIEDKKEKDIE